MKDSHGNQCSWNTHNLDLHSLPYDKERLRFLLSKGELEIFGLEAERGESENGDPGGKGTVQSPLGAAVTSFKRCQLSLTHGDERLVVALHDILVKFLLPFF